jgi:hypothetical protein
MENGRARCRSAEKRLCCGNCAPGGSCIKARVGRIGNGNGCEFGDPGRRRSTTKLCNNRKKAARPHAQRSAAGGAQKERSGESSALGQAAWQYVSRGGFVMLVHSQGELFNAEKRHLRSQPRSSRGHPRVASGQMLAFADDRWTARGRASSLAVYFFGKTRTRLRRPSSPQIHPSLACSISEWDKHAPRL